MRSSALIAIALGVLLGLAAVPSLAAVTVERQVVGCHATLTARRDTHRFARRRCGFRMKLSDILLRPKVLTIAPTAPRRPGMGPVRFLLKVNGRPVVRRAFAGRRGA